jgi:hypothetical protein
LYRFILLENSFQEYAKRYNVTISVCVMKGFKKGDIQNSYIFISSNFNVFLQTGYQKRFTSHTKHPFSPFEAYCLERDKATLSHSIQTLIL